MENSTDENTTEPNLRTIFEAINSLREEFKAELRDLNVRVTAIETDMREVKAMQFVFRNEINRLLASYYKSMNLSYENRINVRFVRKNIEGWSKTVNQLDRQVA